MTPTSLFSPDKAAPEQTERSPLPNFHPRVYKGGRSLTATSAICLPFATCQSCTTYVHTATRNHLTQSILYFFLLFLFQARGKKLPGSQNPRKRERDVDICRRVASVGPVTALRNMA